MHCEIIDPFVEIQLKELNLKSDFWVPELGCPNQYTSLPNGQDMTLRRLNSVNAWLWLFQPFFSLTCSSNITKGIWSRDWQPLTDSSHQLDRLKNQWNTLKCYLIIVCTPPPCCWGDWTSHQIFKKGGEGGLTGSKLLEGVAGKEAVTFFRGLQIKIWSF